MAAPANGRTLKKADPSTIHNKLLVGYQGWFTCPGDGPRLDPNHHGWLHWFNYPLPDGGRPNTDLWPDVSEYSPSELFAAPGLKYANGDQAFLFSSRNARTVERHFHWMALHGVDGAFLQRFLGQCDLEQGNQAIRDQRDEVGDHVRKASEKEGRTFAIMYDISGVAPDRIEHIIRQDWKHIIYDKGVLDSPNYLRQNGKAVVTLWGFGMNDNNHDPAMVRRVTAFIRENTPGGAYIMGGSPAFWRTSESDADRNPEWVNVWLEEFDAISPWTIGRYSDLEGVDRFAEWNVKRDLELINKRNEEAAQGVPGRRHIDYIPVAFPGGSGFNLSEGKWGWNDISRRGGRFFWRELWNLRRLGVRTIYGAMWDEYDEGTAFLPVVSKKSQVPVHDKYNFMALDEDGFDLPSDWYMRVAGFAAESLHGERLVQETFPSKELEDYWSSRPRYEPEPEKVASGSGGQSWEEWSKLEKAKDDLPPPPPYSLEAGEPAIPPRPTPVETKPASPTESRVGALNASPARSPDKPTVPLTSRPSITRPAEPSSSRPASGPSAPPVRMDSRPPPSDPVSSLVTDFGRQQISSPPPSNRLEPPLSHSSRPNSRPTSPGRPSTCLDEQFPGYPNLPEKSSYAPPPHSPSGFSMPGMPTVQHASGPWSQAAWPPPEWGVKPSSPTGAHSGFPNPDYGGSSYSSGYNTGYPYASSPPPPLTSHPSLSRPHHSQSSNSQSHSPEPSHSQLSSPQHQPSPFGFPDAQPGGFSFPQADTTHGYPYAQPPQPHAAPQPYAAYGSSSPPPQFPSSEQYNVPYPVYRPSHSTSPPPGGQGHYSSSSYTPPSSYPQGSNGQGPSSFGPPPPRPGSAYPGTAHVQPQGQGQGSRPGLLGGPLLGSIGGLGGGRIQSLAQTGLSTGEKLFNKLRK